MKMKATNDNLELNCKWSFPSWWYEQSIGWVKWEIDKICHWCKYLQACTMKRSSEILLWETLSPESFKIIWEMTQLYEQLLFPNPNKKS